MKRYTRSLERVWAAWHRRERARKRQAELLAAGGGQPRLLTPDNSEPWPAPQKLEDLWELSRKVKERADAWMLFFGKSSAD